MNNNLIIHDMPGGVIYIENAFPLHKQFLDAIEQNDDNEIIQKVIPKWEKWIDGGPIKVENNGVTEWVWVQDEENSHRGVTKFLDWDCSVNDRNSYWPRKSIPNDYSESHEKSYDILKMIEDPYLDMLEIWYEKTGNKKLDWVTRNYTIRKYKTGGDMGPHVDRNYNHAENSMDWTALIYLNDDYEGGELVFTEMDYQIKPSAGSIVFLPCDAVHKVNKVLTGNKTYIFLFMHTEFGISTALGEPYHSITRIIRKSRGQEIPID